jgi:hypothetical protein
VLENAGFEEGFRYHDDVGELQVGNGWTPWYVEREGLHRPEYKEETRATGSGRVHEGNSAQKMFTTFSKHDAGLYQAVAATPGWTSSESNPDESKGGKYAAMIGGNGWGSYPYHHSTVWGREGQHDKYNEWQELECYFQAYGDRVTIFTRGLPEWPTKHNDSYWDSFKLEAVSAPGEELPEPPEPEPPPAGECRFEDNSATILHAIATGARAFADSLDESADTI